MECHQAWCSLLMDELQLWAEDGIRGKVKMKMSVSLNVQTVNVNNSEPNTVFTEQRRQAVSWLADIRWRSAHKYSLYPVNELFIYSPEEGHTHTHTHTHTQEKI